MAEQTSTAPEKSAGDVTKSSAREQAEQRTSRSAQGSREQSNSQQSGSKYTASQEQTWHTPAHKAEKGDDSGVHPMTGKSLEYTSGPGRESYVPGLYASDSVNQLDHLQVHMVPRDIL